MQSMHSIYGMPNCSESFWSGPLDNVGLGEITGYIRNFGQLKGITNNPLINDSQLLRICKCLRSCRTLDWLLCFTGKRYRDHSTHMWDVATLGWDLLHVYFKYGVNLHTHELMWWFAAKSMRNIEARFSNHFQTAKPPIAMAWWLAALLHDHAYPLAHFMQSTNKLIKLLSNNQEVLEQSLPSVRALLECFSGLFYDNIKSLLNHQPLQEFESHIREFLCEMLVSRWRVIAEEDIPTDERLYDHGLWAAANLAGLLGSINVNETMQMYLKPVLKAIILHSSDKEIDIQKDPLAWLLTLCDEVQEWNRFTIFDTGAIPEMEYIEMEGITKNQDMRFFEEELKFTFFPPKQETLTGWEINKFIASKLKNFKRLRVPKNFHPKYIIFEVKDRIGYKIDMCCGNCTLLYKSIP